MDYSGMGDAADLLDRYNFGVCKKTGGAQKKTAGPPLGAPPSEEGVPGYTVASMALFSFCANTVLGTTPTCLSTS